MCAGQRNSSLGGPIANQAGGGHTTWLVADFDGDHISDLAVGRTETSCFQLEIHLSTQPNKASVHHRDVLAGMAFLVYDIDRDNDQDLILANPGSLYPAAVWLNDGRGHFEETERLGGFSLVREDPLTLETESSQAEPVAIAQDDDRPLDKSGVLQATVASGTTSLFLPAGKDSPSKLGPFMFLRAAPLLTLLSFPEQRSHSARLQTELGSSCNTFPGSDVSKE